MPIHDYIISNGTGAAVRADINSALSAIVSLNSNASEPGTMYAYQLWADTAAGLLKIRNGANSAWVTLRQLDGDFSIVAVEDGLQATPSLTFTNDLNTGVFRSGADALAIVTGGQYAIACTSTQAVGIRTPNPSTALHVAGNARVGADDVTDAHLQIGKGASGNRNSYIDIVADTTYTDYGLRIIRNNTGANATSELKHRGTGALNFTTQEAAPIVFNTTNSPSMTILAGGNVGIGTSNVKGTLGLEHGNTSPQGLTDVAIDALRISQGAGGIVAIRTTQYDAANQPAAGDTQFFNLYFNGSTYNYYERMRIRADGRVGIGTQSPLSRLHVEDSGEPIIYIRRDTTSATSLGGPIWRNNSFNVASIITQNINSNSADLTFSTSSGGSLSERARIDSSGRMLVGTTNDAGSGSNRIVVGSNGICGVKKTFTNLDTTPQSFGFQANNASVYVAHLQSVSTASVAFLIACVYDTAVGIVMATTALGGCTAGGTAATISGITGDARTYTFQRDPGAGEFTVTASAVATGSTIIALTPLNQFL